MGEGGTFEISADLDVENQVYHVTFALGDEQVELTEASARRWVDCVVAALTSAEYEAGIIRQLTRLGVRQEAIGMLIAEFRSRVVVPELRLLGLSVVGQASSEGKPFLQIYKDGVNFGQMSTTDARSHAAGVLESMNIASRDTTFLQLLTTEGKVPFNQATQMVATVGMYREAATTPESTIDDLPMRDPMLIATGRCCGHNVSHHVVNDAHGRAYIQCATCGPCSKVAS